MNEYEKKIAIHAFELGVNHERVKSEFNKDHFKRKSDSPRGTAIEWGTKLEHNNDGWRNFEQKL